MGLDYTSEQVEEWRDRVHRRTPGRAVGTKRQALAFIESVGFCFAFKAENSELPCLWHAAMGMRNPIMPLHTHHDPGIGFVWEMKDVLPAEGKIHACNPLSAPSSRLSAVCQVCALHWDFRPSGSQLVLIFR